MAFGRKAKKAAKYYALWKTFRGASALSLFGSAAFGAWRLYKNSKANEGHGEGTTAAA